MTHGRTIYVINQSVYLLKIWRELTDIQKRIVIKECEAIEKEDEIEKIFLEIIYGQRRMF